MAQRTIEQRGLGLNGEYRSARIGFWLGAHCGALALALEPIDAWLGTRRYLLRSSFREGWRRVRHELHVVDSAGDRSGDRVA